MNYDFERLLANHCAPLLFGKKPAVLLAEKCFPPSCEWSVLHQYGFRMIRLRRQNGKSLLFLYQPRFLEEALAHPVAAQRLNEMGYSCAEGLISALASLRRRFEWSKEFPHEIGFFLGYPPEDVIGFLSGKDTCKICKQWKVYSDINRATALFDEYASCKQTLLAHIKSGNSIFSVISPVLAG